MPTRSAFFRLIVSFVLVAAGMLTAIDRAFAGQSTTFDLGPVGAAVQSGNTVIVAASLNNTGNSSAFHLSVTSITLHGSSPLDPTLPIAIAAIDDGKSAVVQATFDATQLTPGQTYTLVVDGTYQAQTLAPSHARCPGTQPIVKVEEKTCSATNHRPEFVRQRVCCLTPNGHTHCKPFAHCPSKVATGKIRQFHLSADVTLPPAAPGSAAVQTGTVDAKTVAGGGFAPFPPAFEDDEENGPGWIVPTGPFVAGTPTASNTGALQAPAGDKVVTRTPRDGAGVVTFTANDAVGGQNTIAEPSGAVGGGVIFVTANTFAAFSTDGGATYTQLNPTTIFPADAVGFCCDQIVQYVPSIDRFVWLLQGNGMRIAVASPADVKNSGGTAWTYWNLTPDFFGQPATGTGLDYPDLSVGNGALYMSWDAGFPCGPGCRPGFQVARTSLAGLQAGGTITIDYTDPANGRMAWGSHITQNTLDEVFWAGHDSSSQMRIFSLAEGSNTYFWRDVDVASWANNAVTSTTPDGQDWLKKNFNSGGNSFPRNGVIGATRSGNQVWFGWTAGTDSNFQQAHVELVTFDRANDFALRSQQQIWNNGYAFAYPALATNACTGEIGLSLEFGGGGNYENHVVGFWGDFVVYATTSSNTGTSRFGDYVTIRQSPGQNGAFFDAFGYGLETAPRPATSGVKVDVRHVQFGRGGSCEGPG